MVVVQYRELRRFFDLSLPISVPTQPRGYAYGRSVWFSAKKSRKQRKKRGNSSINIGVLIRRVAATESGKEEG